MIAYLYPISLALFSVLVFALERFFPCRPGQKQFRPRLWSDFIHLIFNGHFLGILLAGLATTWILPHVDRYLGEQGLMDTVYRNAAAEWPLWLQIIVALVVVDFIQWCVHNMLHRVPALWELHKAHHSVTDGEMDWIVSFRFSWLEVMVYKSVLYLPLVFFGFGMEALLFHAIFGTLIGHLNHANLDWGHGAWRYVLNSPRMHIWHHDYQGNAKTTVNFGIIFSAWDWIFGTAKMPGEPPAHLGFAGVETFPKTYLAQQIWPLQRIAPKLTDPYAWSAVGFAVLAAAFWFSEPRRDTPQTPMLGEPSAASQPTAVVPDADAYARSPEEAERGLATFGTAAEKMGYAHPEAMVHVSELAAALGARSLRLLDVRPADRFATGHIPGARRLDRGDYSSSKTIPGLSRSTVELQQQLRALGVSDGSTVVLYGDGGPEPYRLWWTLRQSADYNTRVLDGGLTAWKAGGHHVAAGPGIAVSKPGDLTLSAGIHERDQHWEDAQRFLNMHRGAPLLDTRTAIEFSGAEKHEKAERAGRIPGAVHLEWTQVLRDGDRDARLLPPAELSALFERHQIRTDGPVLTYCQSGTRSAAVYYALFQLGADPAALFNYDGSWAEYSRLASLPVAP